MRQHLPSERSIFGDFARLIRWQTSYTKILYLGSKYFINNVQSEGCFFFFLNDPAAGIPECDILEIYNAIIFLTQQTFICRKFSLVFRRTTDFSGSHLG